jgi:fructokinase
MTTTRSQTHGLPQDRPSSSSPAAPTEIPVPPTLVADTVGAGDSFMAAMLAGLADRNLLGAQRRAALRAIGIDAFTELLTESAVAAAVTCSRPGADPPTRSELSLATDAAHAGTGAVATEV